MKVIKTLAGLSQTSSSACYTASLVHLGQHILGSTISIFKVLCAEAGHHLPNSNFLKGDTLPSGLPLPNSAMLWDAVVLHVLA